MFPSVENGPPCFLSLGETGAVAAFEACEDGLALRFEAPAGLYQFSVIADGAEFDWDELYIELHAFHNEGQRTGPWDFHPIKQNTPLVPSYWVYLDGQKIGLWFFARISLEDLAARRFRGRMACWLREGGEHELKFVPYRPFQVRWLSSRLETDPDDTLLLETAEIRGVAPLERWRDEAYWAEKRTQLQGTHALYQEPLDSVFERILQDEDIAPNEWLALVVAYRLGQRPDALQVLLDAVDDYLARPHWSNPREDGYGHDGDMGAAFTLRGFTWAYFGLWAELGEARRERMLAKIALQGERFLALALLNRDYWGGSVLQDHGWRSTHTFAFVALSLAEVLPQAREWLRYILPRSERALRAMPRDGVVPPSSHNSVILYLDDLTDLRDALLAYDGRDIYEIHPFQPILDFLSAGGTQYPPTILLGGNGFLNQMAAKYDDSRAAGLQQYLLENRLDEWPTVSRRHGYHAGVVRGFLTFDPSVTPAEPNARTRLNYFADSGQVHFHDATDDVTFSLRCGPWVGQHAYRHATGPCDRMGMAPGAGHFVLSQGGVELLATPDPGYALKSVNQSCLLIGGRGQYGDVGYPMSIPSWLHRGEEIESVSWDERNGTGLVRLHLAPAYPAEAAVAHYTREFVFQPGRILMRDHVVLSRPQSLSWLFQGMRERGLSLDKSNGLRANFGGPDGIAVEARPLGTKLTGSIRPTPVVWSYGSANGFKPFDHVRFDSEAEVTSAQVDFELRW